MIVCRICKKEKELTDFYKRGDTGYGLRSECKKCFNQMTHKNRIGDPKQIKYIKAWRIANPDKIKDYRLKRSYNMSLEEYREIYLIQKERCAICKAFMGKHQLAVDHNHKTGDIRGLLCNNCNNGLGRFKDNPQLLENAIKYLTL